MFENEQFDNKVLLSSLVICKKVYCVI